MTDHRTFDSGSVRDSDEGKGSPSLLSPVALMRFSKQLQRGAEKYAAHNWRKSQPFSVLLDSAQRHLWKYIGGSNDEDHLAAVMFGIAALMEQEFRVSRGDLPASLDDRFSIFDPNEDSDLMVKDIGPKQHNLPTPDETDEYEKDIEAQINAVPGFKDVGEGCKLWCPCGSPIRAGKATGLPLCQRRGVAVGTCEARPTLDGFHRQWMTSVAEMKARGIKRVYLAGPMSGIPEWNAPAFARVAARLRDAGLSVVSPGELDDVDALDALRTPEWTLPTTEYEKLLTRDFDLLLSTDAVVLLPGWFASGGARREVIHAQENELPVICSWHID